MHRDFKHEVQACPRAQLNSISSMPGWWKPNPFPEQPWSLWDEGKGQWKCLLCDKYANQGQGHAGSRLHARRLDMWNALCYSDRRIIARAWGTEYLVCGEPPQRPAERLEERQSPPHTVTGVPGDTVVIAPTKWSKRTDLLIGFEVSRKQAATMGQQLLHFAQHSSDDDEEAVTVKHEGAAAQHPRAARTRRSDCPGKMNAFCALASPSPPSAVQGGH